MVRRKQSAGVSEKVYKMNSELEQTGPPIMTKSEIAKLSESLQVTLPQSYREFLSRARPEEIDDTSLLGDPDIIIEATNDYRRGFVGLPPWPNEYIYLGDEADACPYVLDCITGIVRQLQKGNIDAAPIKTWSSFENFVAFYSANFRQVVPAKEQKKRTVLYWGLIVGFVLFWFVVLPLAIYGLSKLF